MNQIHTCLGVVLAGGLSSRMGQNKAFLTPENSSINMLELSKSVLNKAGITNIVESLNFQGSPLQADQIIDQYPDLGPLGGIATIFEKRSAVSGYLFLPVDLPLMTPACLSKLKTHGELSRKACYFDDHFLPLYLPRNAISEMFFEKISLNKAYAKTANTVKNKEFSIKSMLKNMPHQAIQLGTNESNQLFNCNTPQQWQDVQQQIKIRVS